MPRNAKGGVMVQYESIKPAWKFIADSTSETREPDPTTDAPAKLPLKGVAQVCKAVHCRMTVKEVSWIFNAQANQEEVALEHTFNEMKDNADERIDPVNEAFRMICKDTTKGSYVDVQRVVEVYRKLGLGGMDERFMQEVIDTVVNELPESSKRKSRRKIDLATFRKLCCFPPEEEEEEEEEKGVAQVAQAAGQLAGQAVASGFGAVANVFGSTAQGVVDAANSSAKMAASAAEMATGGTAQEKEEKGISSL